jgi:hypothetical protein
MITPKNVAKAYLSWLLLPYAVLLLVIIVGYMFLIFTWNNLDCFYRSDCSVLERWKVCSDGGACEGLTYQGIIDGGGYNPEASNQKLYNQENKINQNANDIEPDERLKETPSLGTDYNKSQDKTENDNLSNEDSLWISARSSMTWEKADEFCENSPPKGKYILPTTEQLTSIVNEKNRGIVAWTRIPRGPHSHIIVDLNDGRVIQTGDEDTNKVLCVVH